jgi:hypothetical protein
MRFSYNTDDFGATLSSFGLKLWQGDEARDHFGAAIVEANNTYTPRLPPHQQSTAS